MLVYEYPFNETVRSILRLEYLFQRLEVFLQSDNPEHHLTAISLMFDIGDVTSRADLKSSLLKELERPRALLASFRTEASVNSAALELTINDLENCLSKLNQLVGRPNTLINESEWLAIIRSRLSVPGGTSPVDVPSFYCWQQLPAKQRREQLIAYTPAFVDWQTTCNLYLKLLRQAGEAQGVFSESGSGTDSFESSMSMTTSATIFLMPLSALSGDLSSQDRDGNSAHKPMCILSGADQVTRYV